MGQLLDIGTILEPVGGALVLDQVITTTHVEGQAIDVGRSHLCGGTSWTSVGEMSARTVDDTGRRGVNTQTTVQESRHKLARTIYHGKRDQIYQAYREGQEDQLAALGLVVNAVVL